MAIHFVIAIVQSLCKFLPESLHPGGDNASIGNVQLWRAQCFMVAILDGQNVGQLKGRTEALIHCCMHFVQRNRGALLRVMFCNN